MAKRTKEFLRYGSIAILIFLSLVLFVLLLNFETFLEIIIKDDAPQEIKITNLSTENKKLIKDLQSSINVIDKDLSKDDIFSKKILSEVDDYELNKDIIPEAPKEIIIEPFKDEIEKPKLEIIKPKSKYNTPKLVIIIDDIVSDTQVEALNNTGLHLTLSFLPPTQMHPNSATLALNQHSAMVHLPLEAMNYSKKERRTLKITDTKNEIEEFVKQIRQEYPNVKYLNNHTGSKFTADFKSMYNLFGMLNKYNFKFVDSRTTKYTKANEVAQNLKMSILSRDVFLDNKLEIDYIQNQLREAIKKAKIQGYAIAIGHPHPVTIEAIKSMKKEIKQQIDVIYIEDLI